MALVFQPRASVKKLLVKLVNEVVEFCEARCWNGGAKGWVRECERATSDLANKKQVMVNQVPALCVALVKIRLEDDQMLLPLQKWQVVKPRRKVIEASLSSVSGDTLVFKSKRNKTIRVLREDLSPMYLDEVFDALKAHQLRWVVLVELKRNRFAS